MSTTHPTPGDLIRDLKEARAGDIQARLADLAAEQRALRTVLRALLARDRQRERLAPRRTQGGDA